MRNALRRFGRRRFAAHLARRLEWRRRVFTLSTISSVIGILCGSAFLVLGAIGEVAAGDPFPLARLLAVMLGIHVVVGAGTALWTSRLLRETIIEPRFAEQHPEVLGRALDGWLDAAVNSAIYAGLGIAAVLVGVRGPAPVSPEPTDDADVFQALHVLSVLFITYLVGVSLLQVHHVARACRTRSEARLRPVPAPARGILSLGRALGAARTEILPLPSDPRPDEPAWTDHAELWTASKRLRVLRAVVAAVCGIYLTPAFDDVLRVEERLGLAFFTIFVVALTTILIRLASSAVRLSPRTPVQRGMWLRSRERRTYLTKLTAISLIFGRVYFTILVVLVVGALLAPTLQDVGVAHTDFTLTLAHGFHPFLAVILSVMTLGSLALVNDAYKECMLMRADVRHHDSAGLG